MQQSDYVFHLAALWLFECARPRGALDINVVGTYNVVEAAHEAGVQKVVCLLVGLGLRRRALPMTEEHPFNNRTMYGATKIAGEQFLRGFHEQHGLDWVGLRYMNVYGPDGLQGRVRQRDHEGAGPHGAGEAPVIFGDGSQAYDFVHVHDVAQANILALKRRHR